MRAFGVSVWLHLALTGLLMYGFLRSGAVGAGRLGALTGGIIWQLSTWQVGWLALPTFLCVSAWLPLTLWLTYRLVVRPNAARATLLGLALGLTILAGHLQIALYGFLLTSAYALFLLVRAVRLEKAPLGPIVGGFALALIVMGWVSAPQILPTLELSRVSHRSGAVANWESYQGVCAPCSAVAKSGHSVPAGRVRQSDRRHVLGHRHQWRAERIRRKWLLMLEFWPCAGDCRPGEWVAEAGTVRFFSIAAVLALLLALGTPLNALLYFGLPGFAQSGSPGRILVLWTFSAAVLAAIGMDSILSLTRRQGRSFWHC